MSKPVTPNLLVKGGLAGGVIGGGGVALLAKLVLLAYLVALVRIAR